MTITAKAVSALVLASICHGPFATASQAADAPDKVAAIVDHAFRPLLAEQDVPGIAVAVTLNGQQFFFNYGVASKADNVPVTKNTPFEIGSLSKTFTATLVSYAVATGKISLDDHPGKYMPQLRGRPIDQASLLNLGTFTAGGLPLQFPASVTNDARMVSYFRSWQRSANPGTQRRYSNPSIGLFGHVTALALQADFADLVERQIFPPLGLAHSFIRVPGAQTASYAWGYDQANKPIRVTAGVLGAEAYGVRSTAADMIRFVEANINPETLTAPLRSAIEGTHVGYFRIGEMVQGLGWEQYSFPVTLQQLLAGNSTRMIMDSNAATALTPPRQPSEPILFNKTGSTNGFGAYVAFVPLKKIGIVMLANKNLPTPARITAVHAVLEQLLSASP